MNAWRGRQVRMHALFAEEPRRKVKAHAHFTVFDAIDLALLTGQPPPDVLKIDIPTFGMVRSG